MKKKYFTEEELKQVQREYNKRSYKKHKEKRVEYYQDHKDEIAEYGKQYRQDHKEEMAEYMKQYRLTPKGRAWYLVGSYRQNDKEQNRGECTITSEWIVENVFSGQCCHYCGESDWTKLGCDRIDNSLPHTPENVVVCCKECNLKKARYAYDEFMRLLGKIN